MAESMGAAAQENLPSFFDKLLYGGVGKRLGAFLTDVTLISLFLCAVLVGYNTFAGTTFLIHPSAQVHTSFSKGKSGPINANDDGRAIGQYKETQHTLLLYGFLPVHKYTLYVVSIDEFNGVTGEAAIAWPSDMSVDSQKALNLLLGIVQYGDSDERVSKVLTSNEIDQWNPYAQAIEAYSEELLRELFSDEYFNLIDTQFWGLYLYLIYATLMEGSRFQGTLGKRLMKVRVTDNQGNPIGFAKAAVRNVSKIISAALACIGFFMVLWTERRRGLHDMIAKTVVVNDMHLDKVREKYAVKEP